MTAGDVGSRVHSDVPAFARILLVMALWVATLLQPRAAATAQCRIDGSAVKLPDLAEASGITSSRNNTSRLWAINDSGPPVLVAMDTRGSIAGRVRLANATVVDWEAVSSARCPDGSCLYVADIGDNNASRKYITVYRTAEPATANTTVRADVFNATYPDGAHDAETLLAMPDGRVYIVTKGSTGPVAIYRFPREWRSGAMMPLERVGGPRNPGKARNADWVTDGDVSRDGSRIVLRTHHALYIYPAAQLLAGNWGGAQVIDLKELDEPQGEGVAYGAGNTMYLIGEGGGAWQPGLFARLSCTPDR